jgi:diguanylate cyclase (GGDEF)-like protein
MAAIDSLHERERLLDRLTEALPQGVMQLDRSRAIVHQNGRVEAVTGRPRSETFDETFALVVEPDRTSLSRALDAVLIDGVDQDIEVRSELPDEAPRVLQVLLRGIDGDGLTSSVIVSVSDVTEQVRLRDELEHQARVDAMTGCLNRRSVMRAIEDRLADADDASATAVVFIDLDGFKSVNDELGHAAGDELLATVAQRLQKKLRSADLVGRLGGDEFLVVLPGLSELRRAQDLAERLAEEVEQPVVIADSVIVPRASYGVACARHDGITVDELVARADRAMYESKQAGRGRPLR